MKLKRKGKKISFILYLLIPLLFYCSDKEKSNIEKEDYIFEESDLEYSMDIHNDLNSMYFLLDQKKNIINVLVYKEKKIIKEFDLKIDKTKSNSFIKIIKSQLELKNVFNETKNKSGFGIVFCIDLGTNELSASYPKILNFKKDVSLDFDELMSFLKKEKLIDEFLEKK
jgi:hypothetical protein